MQRDAGYPHLYDHVYISSRLPTRNPHGWVIDISKRRNEDSEREVTIRFARSLWVGENNMDLHDPEFCLEGGDLETLTFEEFYEYKVSSELQPMEG